MTECNVVEMLIATRSEGTLLMARVISRTSTATSHGQPFFKSQEQLEYFQKLNAFHSNGKFNALNNFPKLFQKSKDHKQTWPVYEKMVKNPSKLWILNVPEWQFIAQVLVFIGSIVAGLIFWYCYNRFWPEHLRLKYKHRYGQMSHLSAEVTGEAPHYDDHGHH